MAIIEKKETYTYEEVNKMAWALRIGYALAGFTIAMVYVTYSKLLK